MTQSLTPPEPSPLSREPGNPGNPGEPMYRGVVAYIYAFDVAQEMQRELVRTVLGQPVTQFAVDLGKRGPRDQFFYRPQTAHLPAVEYATPWGQVKVERSIKLFPVGAISLVFRVPFEVARIEDLVSFHALSLGGVAHDAEARHLVDLVRTDLGKALIQPVAQVRDEEAYTVFCLEAPLGGGGGRGTPARASAADWLDAHRRQVAALLTEERDPDSLSAQETDDTTSGYLSYYGHDLVVMDWDAALVVDERRNFDEQLHTVEMANVQLAELEAYDRILDEALERSYRDLAGRQRATRSRRDVLRELRELRLDMAHLTDELDNTTKFFGDWHLARVYRKLCDLFHIDDWRQSIDQKLRTLDDLYRLLQQDVTNRWMMVLEVTVVLLFVIELVLVILSWVLRW